MNKFGNPGTNVSLYNTEQILKIAKKQARDEMGKILREDNSNRNSNSRSPTTKPARLPWDDEV